MISDDTAIALWRLIEALSQEEGDSVTILCPNPDFNNLPDYTIECNGSFTEYKDQRFSGNSYLECLQKALSQKQSFDEALL